MPRYYLVAPWCGKCKGRAVYVIEDADHNPVAHVCNKDALPTLQELNDAPPGPRLTVPVVTNTGTD